MSAQIAELQGLSNLSVIQLVSKNLRQKYSNSFHFYQVRPLNEIINHNYHSQYYISINDLRIFIDDTEFLRRLYYHRTLTGRPEIDHRLKLCSQHYSKNQTISHHYPMMIVTNTKSLFMNRYRRLHKIQAGEGSSDETEKEDEQFVEFYEPPSFDFLEDLDNSSLDGADQQSLEGEGYDLSQYDIFDDSGADELLNNCLGLKNIDENSLSHLMLEFPSIQLKDLQACKQDGDSTAPYISKPTLISLDNKFLIEAETTSAAARFAQKTPQEGQSRKSSLSKYLELIQNSRNCVLSGLTHNFANSGGNDYLGSKGSKAQEYTQNERSELANRRKRIRQKAEELLRRAKNDEEGENIYSQ